MSFQSRRAAKTNQEEIVRFIFDIKADYGLFTGREKYGRNVFHNALENQEILEYLLTQFVKVRFYLYSGKQYLRLSIISRILQRRSDGSSQAEFMLIGSRQRLRTLSTLPSLEIGGVPVKQVTHAKSLGVHIDENLSRSVHINELIQKIASSIG